MTDTAQTQAPAAGAPTGPVLRTWHRWAVAVAYMAFLFALSSTSKLPTLPGNPSDKLEHAVAFGILGLLLVWALSKGRLRGISARTVLVVTVICAAYGYSDEFHQRFVPGRDYDLKDMAADATGGFLVSGAVWAWGILSRGSRQRHE